MLDAGILCEPEPFELIGGELVAMAAKKRQHEVLRTELENYWTHCRPRDLKIASGTPLRLGDYDAPEPDFIVYPASLRAPDVRADTVLLVAEIADASLGIDLTTKAQRYAAAGVREYWVINARTPVTTVHREPQSSGYADRRELAATEVLTPLLAPSLGVRLAELDLG
jgi:Uma2 family endonuclease